MAHEGLGPDNTVCKTAYIDPVRAQVLADQAAAEAAGDQERAEQLGKTAANLALPEYQKNIEPMAEAVYRILVEHAKTTSDQALDTVFWQWLADVNDWLVKLRAWQQGVATAFVNWAAAGTADINFQKAVTLLADPGEPPASTPTNLTGRVE
ncbi:MAG TPA: hypothetical protein VKA60_13275 [Blastocatellia bacterium]|nr:hypothetical protein [Blastocatellia bacterium]